MKKKVDNIGFSVALGLTDYINPIMYSIICLTIIMNMDKIMSSPWNIIYIGGVVISLIFGFTIPTIKLLVGLGKIRFNLPVKLVYFVNLGIFISGLVLIKNILNINMILFMGIILGTVLILGGVYLNTKKFNNIAVLIGGIGYLLIYISLIYLALKSGIWIAIVFYGIAICLYIMLIGIGIKGNLSSAKTHWIIERVCIKFCVNGYQSKIVK